MGLINALSNAIPTSVAKAIVAHDAETFGADPLKASPQDMGGFIDENKVQIGAGLARAIPYVNGLYNLMGIGWAVQYVKQGVIRSPKDVPAKHLILGATSVASLVPNPILWGVNAGANLIWMAADTVQAAAWTKLKKVAETQGTDA